ncbi:MAG TPA: hypothetical protein VGK81_10655 [Anaerolineae bacterium]
MPRELREGMHRLRLKAESGFTVTIQAVFYIFLLFIFLAFVFDFGLVGNLYSIATASMRVAAQDAAKNIDTTEFANTQEIRLSADALSVAQQEVTDMSGGKVQVLSLEISHLATRDVIVISGHVDCPLPLLGSLFGLQMLIVPVQAYAEPAYGISQEGQ